MELGTLSKGHSESGSPLAAELLPYTTAGA
jgi:hypothetical protein